jgi:hypothetical protein
MRGMRPAGRLLQWSKQVAIEAELDKRQHRGEEECTPGTDWGKGWDLGIDWRREGEAGPGKLYCLGQTNSFSHFPSDSGSGAPSSLFGEFNPQAHIQIKSPRVDRASSTEDRH